MLECEFHLRQQHGMEENEIIKQTIYLFAPCIVPVLKHCCAIVDGAYVAANKV